MFRFARCVCRRVVMMWVWMRPSSMGDERVSVYWREWWCFWWYVRCSHGIWHLRETQRGSMWRGQRWCLMALEGQWCLEVCWGRGGMGWILNSVYSCSRWLRWLIYIFSGVGGAEIGAAMWVLLVEGRESGIMVLLLVLKPLRHHYLEIVVTQWLQYK